MRFLITCYKLDLSGSSTYTFTLASELKRKGHEVFAFSPFPEIIGNELTKKNINVYKTLEEVSNEKYSCIIAQHNVLALMIRSIKPEVPMVFISHSTTEFLEQPPLIDISIQKYIAICEAVKNNLVVNHSIQPKNIKIVRNFVDINRFAPQREINKKPKVVLLLSNRYTSKVYETIKEACRKLCLKLIVIGKTKQIQNTEDYINEADIVISLGRGILEAMSCGRAAIVYDYQGGDGIITPNTIKEIRKWNFTGNRFNKNYDVSDLVKEIQKYEQSMGNINRELILKDYNASLLSDKIINICNQAHKNFRPKPIAISSKELIWYQSQIKNILPINVDQNLNIQSNFCINILAALNELEAIHNSHGWKFLKCYYNFRDKIFPINTKRRAHAKSLWKTSNKVISITLQVSKRLRYIFILVRALWRLVSGSNVRKFAKVWATYKFGGIKLCWQRAVEKSGTSRRDFPYDATRNQLLPKQSKYILAKCSSKPLISIITPVYKVNTKWLVKCIKSVVVQHYGNWELILVDDASGKKDLKQLMNAWSLKDKRIRAFYLEKNCGIAGTTNLGIRQAKGKFIGFLDHDDELTPDALTWVVWAINKYTDASWFYSDEDKISANGECHGPYFKPDFSPELLLSNMFTCHFSVYSADILSKVGGIREGFEGAQDHDLALSISEIVRRDQVIHIPRVLYHWRTIPGSAAMGIEAKPDAALAGRKAVAEALERRNLKGEISSHKLHPWVYQIRLQPNEFPKVSIIIPTRNALLLLKKCTRSIREHTNYPNYEILIVDNQSNSPKLKRYLAAEGSNNHLKVIKYNGSFNHSEINNIAVKSIDSELVVFMNNDIEILSDGWLEQLVATINIDTSIAAVGCLLLYPNGTVQHGGIILGIYGVAGHSHKFLDKQSSGYFGRLHCFQEVSGVTSALSLVRKSAFEAAGGFNSDRYPTSFNDVDLAIRLRKKGYRCLYNPMVQAIHYESKTRPITAAELVYQKRLKDDYSDILDKDPFYNPNLSLDNEQFNGFRPFPVEKQIIELCALTK